MYQIKCDDYVLYDPRMDDLVVLNPRCSLEVNTVGGGSFTILNNHPCYDKLQKLKSIIEISQDGEVIFRGRMTNDTKDFHNQLTVDLEGILAFTNDTIIEPFKFPNDTPDATASDNIVAYFLGWIIEQHNAQVEDWKQFKLGTVTVSDPNNYITRSSAEYDTTWNTLKSKLFESALGGYLVIRYEDDGNYIDYISEFELTNVQPITFGKNLLGLTSQSDATSTYSAILPLGGEITTTGADGEEVKTRLTLESLEDGDLPDGLVKQGKFIYSKSARDAFGWVCVPPKDSMWNDVNTVDSLKRKAIEYLTGTAMLFSGNTTITAVDLSFSDEQIQSFRTYRNILVNSPIHGISNKSYQLVRLDIDILNPQNTVITIGEVVRTLIDINRQEQSNQAIQGEIIKQGINDNKANISNLQSQLVIQTTQIISDCNEIILSALESYVETSNFDQYKETVSTQLQILADEIIMNFTNVTEHITDVDGDLQSKFTEIYKYISYSDGNITLGSSENAITLTIENDMIVFKKNGLQFGWWDGVDFHTGNIVVEVNEKAQFGNFAFIPRTDGSLMFLKVGG